MNNGFGRQMFPFFSNNMGNALLGASPSMMSQPRNNNGRWQGAASASNQQNFHQRNMQNNRNTYNNNPRNNQASQPQSKNGSQNQTSNQTGPNKQGSVQNVQARLGPATTPKTLITAPSDKKEPTPPSRPVLKRPGQEKPAVKQGEPNY